VQILLKMSNLFCSNCKIEIKSNDETKEHYKSEFHRYNIKRTLVSLPPLSLENYLKKKTQLVDVKQQEKETVHKCKACNKTFGAKNTYDQHLLSLKHKENAKRDEYRNGIVLEAPVEGQIEPQKLSAPKPTTVDDQSICLFCNQKNQNVDENLIHMRMEHSFFISDIKYVTDLNGLLRYLGGKIHKGRICIYCENKHAKDFKSGEAVQRHMVDKGHCFMKNEEYDEYVKYYDFSSTLSDYKAKIGYDEAENNTKLKDDEAYLEIVSDDEDDEDDGWEDAEDEEDDEEEDDEDEDEDDQKEGEANKEENKEQTNGEGEIKEKPQRITRIKVKKAVVLPSGEVKLPNGKLLGHREYRQYYSQYFRGTVAKNRMRELLPSLGGTGSTQLTTLNAQNQIILLNRMNALKLRQKRDRINYKFLHRAHVDFMNLGIKANKLQHHFVQQCPL